MPRKSPTVSIIVALGKHERRYSAIGKNNRLLWHIPDDLKRFKSLTNGHPLIMGRKTHESIGKPLPGRTNIIVTRDSDYLSEGCEIRNSFEDAITFAKSLADEEIFIIGGSQIYEQAMEHADRLYLTLIEDEKDADSFFPDYSDFTEEKSRENHEWNGLKYHWVTLER
jgi:dihydrofolate reductase